ncbi:MAG: hypothetical protein EWV91_07015 [Microcystis aeruginosa Ma_QC_Ca_00000000_S207]|uniref:Uncharacterized protein n=1 Tax=Microcystis aeruginosa Ma_QC_Ca_00000000_S207 TaxID=2486251 RepID=A0A552FSV1_MICAE|nr:MAG: hypothetical protein EWV91_07015 [Microcystis aeruginosa Ma_QC_Ca_00000000_S207]
MEHQTQQLTSKKKTILIGMGLALTTVLGYFGWQYWKKRKIQQKDTPIMEEPARPVSISKQKTPPASVRRNDTFPLKRGSKGEKVKALQQAIIAAHGAGILPKYGADGDFGKELEDGLKKLGFPAIIDQSTFYVITTSSGANPSDASAAKALADQLYQAVIRKDIKATIAGLKQIDNVQEYTSVSAAFQTYRVNGVRQTLVNGLLNTFKTPEQKQQLQMELIRMGLQYDGAQWSLSGIEGLTLMTTKSTVVWKDRNTPIPVQNRTVLGKEVTRRNEHVVFEKDGCKFLVKASDVTYLTA